MKRYAVGSWDPWCYEEKESESGDWVRHADAEAEIEKLRDVLVSRHGGEPIALLSELDEARSEIEKWKRVAVKALESKVLPPDGSLPGRIILTSGAFAAYDGPEESKLAALARAAGEAD